MKCCIACRHLVVDPGFSGYSEYTPGWEGTMMCMKRHWNYTHEVDEIQTIMLEKGLDCPDFELSDLAISKGWTLPGTEYETP